jgi:hypothetical protein
MSRNAALLFVLVACVLQRSPVAQGQPFATYGAGDKSCGTWTSLAGTSKRDVLEWWVLGFVSGASRELAARNIQLEETDADAIEGWVDKYCSDHPLDHVVKASILLVDELKDRAKR